MNTNSNDTPDVTVEVKTIMHWLTANDADKELADALTAGWHVMDITVLALPGDIKRVVTLKRIVKPEAPSEYTVVKAVHDKRVVLDNQTPPPSPTATNEVPAIKDDARTPMKITYGVELPAELEKFPDGVTIETPYAEALKHPKVRSEHLRAISNLQANRIRNSTMTMEDVPEGTTYSEAIERGYPTHICSQIGNREAMDAGRRVYNEGMERLRPQMNRPRPWDKAN